MTDYRPIPFFYDRETGSMVPMHKWRAVADKQFVDGATYIMEVVEPRSPETHRHFFAALNEAWKNIPEDQVQRWPTSEHLRKFALVKCGYADETDVVCTSRDQALRFAMICRKLDGYAVIVVSGNVVKVYTAQSQSMHAMGKKAFAESKQKVLDYVSDLIGVDPATLAAQNPQHFNGPRDVDNKAKWSDVDAFAAFQEASTAMAKARGEA